LARLQLFLPLILWAVWIAHPTEPLMAPWIGTTSYFLALALIVLLVRRMAYRAMIATYRNAPRVTERFHQSVFGARLLILALHLAALLYLGLGQVILAVLGRAATLQSLPAIVSMVPVLLAWIGLMWSRYPLDRAIREQNILPAINAGDLIHPVPTLREYLVGGIRLQILFMLAPVLLGLLLRDGIRLVAAHYGHGDNESVDMVASILPISLIILLAPEILRRVLPTEPLPPSPLRSRLEALCQRLNLRYRDILIWRTHHSLGNAAVMGLIPQVRYVMLSDLLLETMTPRQIEAVFAHEAGHIVHRHLAWYVVFSLIFVLWAGGLLDFASGWISKSLVDSMPFNVLVSFMGVGAFFVVFGSLSRSFERQADLFAARSLNASEDDGPVDPIGVETFSSALTTIARINRMPIDASELVAGRNAIMRSYIRLVHYTANWLHGSIRSRVDYLYSLPANPARAERFDRRMAIIRILLLTALCATTGWVLTSMMH
jgi:STE24 endopeptidase